MFELFNSMLFTNLDSICYLSVMYARDYVEQQFESTENGHFQNFLDIYEHCAKTGLQ